MTIQERIAQIDAILQAGTARVRHGDRDITYDLEALRHERERLLASLNKGGNFRRVVFRNG